MDTPRPSPLDTLTHAWCRATGRLFDVSEVSWLNDPPGPPQNVGGGALAFAANWTGLTVTRAGGIGLVDDFADLTGGPFDANRVAAAIRDFYQRTSEFDLSITAESSGAVALAARAIIHLFSRRLGQLDLPMYVSGGEPTTMISEVVHLRDNQGRLRYAAWSRNLPADSNRPVYVGLYGHVTPPKERRPCVKVVFPLPLGTATSCSRPTIWRGMACDCSPPAVASAAAAFISHCGMRVIRAGCGFALFRRCMSRSTSCPTRTTQRSLPRPMI